MNTVYKVIFNKSTGQRSVVSELARGKTKSTTRSLLATVAFGLAVSTAPALADTCAYTGNGIMSCVQTTTDENLSYVIDSFVAPYHVNATKMGTEGSAQLSVSNSNIVGVGSSHALFITGKGGSLELNGNNSITLGSSDDTAILIMAGTGDGSVTVNGNLTININRPGVNNSDAIEVYGNNTTITHSGVGTITTNGGNGILTRADNNAKVVLDGAAIFNISGNNNNGIFASSGSGKVDINSNATITTNGSAGQGIYTAANNGNISITNSGNITTGGGSSEGIFANSGQGNITVTNSGKINSVGHGIYSKTRSGMTTITNTNDITVVNDDTRYLYPRGIYAITTGGDVTIDSLGGSINAMAKAVGAIAIVVHDTGLDPNATNKIVVNNQATLNTQAELGHGINAIGGKEMKIDNSGDITTRGKSASGIWALSTNAGSIAVINSGTINTAGATAHGIYTMNNKAASTETTTITSNGAITTQKDGAHAIYAEQASTGLLTINNTAALTTSGVGAHGIYASVKNGGVTITNSGDIKTQSTAQTGTSSIGINVVRDLTSAASKTGGNISIIDTGGTIETGKTKGSHGISVNSNAISGDINVNLTDTNLIVNSTASSGIRINETNITMTTDPKTTNINVTTTGGSIQLNQANDLATDSSKNYGIEVLKDSLISGSGNITINNDSSISSVPPIGKSGSDGAGIFAEIGKDTSTGNVSVTNSGDISLGLINNAYGIQVRNWGSGKTEVNNSGSITTEGKGSHGIRVNNHSSLTLTNSGQISTTGENSAGIYSAGTVSEIINTGVITTKHTLAHGIYSLAGDNSAKITNTEVITTAGKRAHGLYITTMDADATIDNNAIIITTGNEASGIRADQTQDATSGDITVTTGANSHLETNNEKASGIYATIGSAYPSSGNIIIDAQGAIKTTGADTAEGIYAGIIKPGSTGNINVTFSGDKIETTGAGNNHGIYALQEGSGNLTVSHTGTSISTAGAGAHGIYTVSTNASSTGTTKIDSSGPITTIGDGANAIYAEQASTGLLAIDNTAALATSGTNAHGIYAILGKGASSDITNSGTINVNGAASSMGIYAYGAAGNNNSVINNSGDITHALTGFALYGINVNLQKDNVHSIVNHSGSIVGSEFGIVVWDGNGIGQKDSSSEINIKAGGTIDAFIGITSDIGGTNTVNIDEGATVNGTTRALLLRTNNDDEEMVNAVTNAGTITSDADMILETEMKTIKGKMDLTFINTATGKITGFMDTVNANRVTLDNQGEWNVQDRANAMAQVKLSTDVNNSIKNSGKMNFFNQATEFTGVPNFTLEGGTLDLTKHAGTGTTVSIGLDNPNSLFTSNGGSVFIDTLLNDASTNSGIGTSDRLLLQNTALGSGATQLFVSPMAGSSGAITLNNGIEVVNVSGGNSAAGVFALGHDVLSGAYQYQLTQTGNNWYLTNTTTPIIPPVTPPVVVVPPTGPWIPNPYQPIYRPDAGIELANRESVIDMMVPGLSGSGVAPNGIGGSGAMRSSIRLGGDGDTSGSVLGQKSNSLWTFATMNNNRGKAAGGQIRYSSKSKGLQVGGDRIFAVGDGLIQAGIMTHMSSVDTKSRNLITGATARGESDGYGFGVYATWYAKANDILSPFVDTYAMYGRFKNTVKTRNNSDYSYRSNAFSFTMIGGYPLAVSSNIIVEPQAQLTYVKYGSQNHNDHGNTNITLKTKGNLIGRVGAYVYGHGYKVQPYGALNVWYDDTQSEMRYNINGGKIGADKRGAIFEAKLGFQTQATKNLTLWGEVSGRKGQNSYRDFGGAVGIKYTW